MKIKESTVLTALLSLLLFSCTERDRFVLISGYAQGGTYSVKANLRGVRTPAGVITSAVDSILTLVDTTLSGYNKSSVLSRFNAGETVVPDQLFCDIYNYCSDLYVETDGCLDIASGPLFDIWGFGFSTDSLPSEDLVRETLATCGMSRLPSLIEPGKPLDPSALVEPGAPLPRLNFNAVAQGYTCDLVAGYLRSIGVKDMLVDIGEIYCEGHNPSGRGWTIGVDRPVDGNNEPGADLDGLWSSEMQACGIVTSGNYRKFYIRDGRKYAHTVDPRTGYPVQHQLLSATIVAQTAAEADALATYCMVIGLEEAQKYILGREDIEGYLIYDRDGAMREWASPAFSLIESD